MVHEKSFKPIKLFFRDFEGDTAAHFVRAAFSPSPLVVARRSLRAARDTRSPPLGAAAPPLPKKFFDTFWEPCDEGHTFDKSRGFTFFPEALRQMGGKIQKCDFGFFEKFLK